MNELTCGQALATAQALGLERLDAQLLLLHALGKPDTDRAWLLAHDTDSLAAGTWQHFHALSQRRASGEPLAYITKSTEFFGLQLLVDARVLVPRPDTETLVEWALDRLALASMPPTPQVLDLGTGSGAVALALKKTAPALVVTAVDASDQALTVARHNAARHGLLIQFIQGNWFDKVGGHFHLIVSNPPYVAQGDPHLAALRHEPVQALTAGPDGLDDIGRSLHRPPTTCIRRAGCCWSMATTRQWKCVP